MGFFLFFRTHTANPPDLIPCSLTLLLIPQSQDEINEPTLSCWRALHFPSHKNTFSTKVSKVKLIKPSLEAININQNSAGLGGRLKNKKQLVLWQNERIHCFFIVGLKGACLHQQLQLKGFLKQFTCTKCAGDFYFSLVYPDCNNLTPEEARIFYQCEVLRTKSQNLPEIQLWDQSCTCRKSHYENPVSIKRTEES